MSLIPDIDMQVRVFDVASMSCSHVLAGHTEIVMCLDTCVSSSGRTLIVTGSKDNSVSFSFFICPYSSCGLFLSPLPSTSCGLSLSLSLSVSGRCAYK